MKRQINFFAAPEDANDFHCWLQSSFRNFSCISDSALIHVDVAKKSQLSTDTSLGQATVYLIPEWANDRIIYMPAGSLVALEVLDSPVLEYSPSIYHADKSCIEAGRIYWGFRGELARHEKRQITEIFRWIDTHSEIVPNWGDWRMLDNAKKIPYVRQSVADPKPNPLYIRSES